MEDGTLLLVVSKEIYEKESVLASAYKFTNRCTILIEPIEHSTVGIYFKPKHDITEKELNAVAEEFCNELIDQQLRLEINKNYGNLRDVIVRHAFSPIANLNEEIRID